MDEVTKTITPLLPVIAVALKNAFAHQRIVRQARELELQARELERRVTAHTAELAAANKDPTASRLDSFNRMKDAVEARMHAEQTTAALQRKMAERKQAETRLLASHRRVHDILESISDAFFSLDDNLVVTYFNAAAERRCTAGPARCWGVLYLTPFRRDEVRFLSRNTGRPSARNRPCLFEVDFRVTPYANCYDVPVYPQAQGISVYFQVVTEQAGGRNLAEERSTTPRHSRCDTVPHCLSRCSG